MVAREPESVEDYTCAACRKAGRLPVPGWVEAWERSLAMQGRKNDLSRCDGVNGTDDGGHAFVGPTSSPCARNDDALAALVQRWRDAAQVWRVMRSRAIEDHDEAAEARAYHRIMTFGLCAEELAAVLAHDDEVGAADARSQG